MCGPGPHCGHHGHRRRCSGHDLSLRPSAGSEKAGTPGLCDLLQWHLGSYMVRALGTGAAEGDQAPEESGVEVRETLYGEDE